MDDCCGGPRSVTRRALLRGAAASPALLLLPQSATAAAAQPVARLGGLAVHPRADWAGDLRPTGPLGQEQGGDVRFLLVHHTASGNDYGPDQTPALIRSFYGLHTGPDKNWPDVAYNFFVDRHGEIWEGRTGSLTGPVIADATGGNQGFSQLCCFIGNHSEQPPTPQATQSMTRLLGALADAYAIDTSPGSTATFQSRGSNKWPAGETVSAATISGHRDMSQTECPGTFAYALVNDVFPVEVTALRTATAQPTPSATPTPSNSPPTTSPLAEPAPVQPAPAPAPAAENAPAGPLPAALPVALGVGGTAALGAVGGALLLRRRITSRRTEDGPDGSGAVGPGSAGRSLRKWETVGLCSDTSPNAAVATMLERTASAIIGVVAGHRAYPTSHRPPQLEGARTSACSLLAQAGTTNDPTAWATTVLRATLSNNPASPLDIAVVVVLPGRTALASTDAALGVILTPEGHVYRPHHRRGRNDHDAHQFLVSSLPAGDVAGVLLSAPNDHAGQTVAEGMNLAAVTRRMITWPSVALGLGNHLRDLHRRTGRPTAAIAVVNRQAIVEAADSLQ